MAGVLTWPGAAASMANPYLRLLYRQIAETTDWEPIEFTPLRVAVAKARIWHIHWPERLFVRRGRLATYVRVFAFAGLLGVARVRRIGVVWTLHNLTSRDRFHHRLEDIFMRWFARRLAGVVALSPRGLELAQQRYPALRALPAVVIRHGHYIGAYPDEVSRKEARKKLRLAEEARVLMLFGRGATYKNAVALAETFSDVRASDARLLVVGAGHAEDEKRLRVLAQRDRRIQLAFADIPPETVQAFFRAADAVVLPYADLLNSGTALLALSFGVPVVAPARAAILDLEDQFGIQWVHSYSGPMTGTVLEEALMWLDEPRDRDELRRRLLAELSWATIADETARFYDRLGAP